MLKQFKYKNKPEYGKDVELFHNGRGGVFWSAKDICTVLEIEDADKAIAEIDPNDKAETLVLPENDETADTNIKTPPRKVVVINYRALFSLLFRSQAPIAKKFKSFVDRHLFFDMFLHWSPYFLENEDEDTNADYESLIEDLRVQLGVWG
jgi:prophage antirepressor-like protein